MKILKLFKGKLDKADKEAALNSRLDKFIKSADSGYRSMVSADREINLRGSNTFAVFFTGEKICEITKYFNDDYCVDLCGIIINPAHPKYKESNGKRCDSCAEDLAFYTDENGTEIKQRIGRKIEAMARFSDDSRNSKLK